MIKRETIEQSDGALWHLYDLSGEGVAIVTSRGRELVREHPDVLRKVALYKQKAVGAIATGEHAGIRKHFASGANSDVFTLGSDLVVKEAARSRSMVFALERLDILCSALEKHTPRWVDIPNHYALLSARNLDHDYLVMERIDAGITVDDILKPEDVGADKAELMNLEFYGVDRARLKDDVGERYGQVVDLARTAIRAESLNPNDFLTDLHEGNVLVERLRTPVAGSPYKFWIIDQ